MAINKEKNVLVQITMPKEVYEQLEALKKAYENNDIKVSKSDILVRAFKDYLSLLITCAQEHKDKGGNNNA